jgi:hypothetical protein
VVSYAVRFRITIQICYSLTAKLSSVLYKEL